MPKRILFTEHETTCVVVLAAALLPQHGGNLLPALAEAAARYAATMRDLEQGDPVMVRLDDGHACLSAAMGRLCLERAD